MTMKTMNARFEPTIVLQKAHDVRHLNSCAYCLAIGDRRYMPKVGGKYMHGFCALETLTVDGVLKLPRHEIGKISLGEIGPVAMKAICDRLPPQ
jgi:hypothetical protein